MGRERKIFILQCRVWMNEKCHYRAQAFNPLLKTSRDFFKWAWSNRLTVNVSKLQENLNIALGFYILAWALGRSQIKACTCTAPNTWWVLVWTCVLCCAPLAAHNQTGKSDVLCCSWLCNSSFSYVLLPFVYCNHDPSSSSGLISVVL